MYKVIYSFVLISFLLISCNGTAPKQSNQTEHTTPAIQIVGNTQGTTYTIICNDSINIDREEIEEVLHQFDLALSGYIDESIVSQLNNNPAGIFAYRDTHNYFNRCYLLSQEIYERTNGAFDPTVYPLVDGWGFMKKPQNVPDSSTVDSLLALVSFEKGKHFDFLMDKTEEGYEAPLNKINKRTPGSKLDFNAIAQGLSVDVLAELLDQKGAKNYYVEIGGEIRVKGKNSEGNWWRIGIDRPFENSNATNREITEIVEVKNQAIATSGSYRKFYEKEGKKYSHTLNPKTGYPVTHTLLSATVIASTCAEADAMATAFMVMGHEKAISFLEDNPQLNIEAYLIYATENSDYQVYYTPKFGKAILL